VSVDGHDIAAHSLSSNDARLASASFDPAWGKNESREIVADMDLLPNSTGRGTVAVSADAFFVADQGVLPLWQPPGGLFSKGGPTPTQESLTVFAPPDFRVIAPGKTLKPRAEKNLLPRTFQLKPKTDFPPYVVAGRYQEQLIHEPKISVSFWTFAAADAARARTAGPRISSAMQAFRDFFGPATEGNNVVRIVEAPGQLPDEFGDTAEPGGVAFPSGALLDQRVFTQNFASERILMLVEYELAQTWFGWRVRPAPEARILMGRGAALFAVVVASESRGLDERTRAIADLLHRYDAARSVAADKPLLESAADYSPTELVSTGYRAALFFVALEDLCGHDSLRAAFRDLIHTRANDTVGYEELRAATEAACRRDLAETFRTWIKVASIPGDFRSRYATARNAQD